MKPEGASKRLSVRLFVVSGLLLLAMSGWLWSMREGVMPRLMVELRELKTQRLLFARALDVLQDNQSVIKTLQESPVDVDSLILSLIEKTEQQASILNARISRLSVTDSSETLPQSASDDASLHFLRVDVSAVLQRADDLLSLLDGVREVADWRPIEVRGCSLTQKVDIAGLHVVCAIDVYYFPELDA